MYVCISGYECSTLYISMYIGAIYLVCMYVCVSDSVCMVFIYVYVYNTYVLYICMWFSVNVFVCVCGLFNVCVWV